MIRVAYRSPLAPVLLSDDGDAAFERQLCRALEDGGLLVWSRADQEPTGSPLEDILRERLDTTRMLVVAVTGRARPKEAIGRRDDINIALERVRRRVGVVIVPVPIGGASLDPYFGLNRYVPVQVQDDASVEAAVVMLVRAFRALDEAACDINGVQVAEETMRTTGLHDAPRDVGKAHASYVEFLKQETGVASKHAPRVGLFLAGRWVLHHQLGQGGFAEVWQAWDTRRKRDVAVKVMHPHIAHSRQHRERIERGVEQMLNLGPNHAVEVLDAPARHEGCYFFVMDHLVGGDLEYRIRKNKISRRLALRALVGIARSLDVAHGKGIVHRDVKPANILFAGPRRAVLTDFDLVLVDGISGGTRTGPLGSYLFSAPEALLDAQGATALSDVYSLGMCAAFVVLEPEKMPSMMRDPGGVLAEAVESGTVHAGLRDIILAAVAWEPSARTQSAADFARALEVENRKHRIGRRAAGELCDRRTQHRPDLVYIPRTSDSTPDGLFLMGADDSIASPPPDEVPHEVVLTRAFLMARTPITVSQYRAVLAAIGREHENVMADDIPVTPVTWFQAVEFCNVLSALEDLMLAYDVSGAVPRLRKGSPGYRLATEAEWEYACRASGPDAATATSLGNRAWYAHNSERQPCSVHDLAANSWGLRHMLGNVWEWCHDGYEADIANDRANDPHGPPDARNRVIRGGSCIDPAQRVRPSFRRSLPPNLTPRRLFVGFRIVRTILEDD